MIRFGINIRKRTSGRKHRVGSRLARKVRRLFLDRHAVSVVVSTLIMVGAVIALGFAVLSWTYSRSSVFNMEYANLVDANSERMKEKLVFEYVFYNASSSELTVYLINCGKSNDVSLANVYLSNGSWFQSFSDIELRFLNGAFNSEPRYWGRRVFQTIR